MGYEKRLKIFTNVMTAKSTTGIGTSVDVSSFRNMFLEVTTSSGLTSGTLKIQHSISDSSPSFGTAASATNPWAYIAFYNLVDGILSDGSTGLTLAGNSVYLLEVNSDASRFMNCDLTAISGGNVNVKLYAVDNA